MAQLGVLGTHGPRVPRVPRRTLRQARAEALELDVVLCGRPSLERWGGLFPCLGERGKGHGAA